MSELYHAQQLPLFPTRVCRRCQTEYPLDTLHFEKTRKEGSLGLVCRTCRAMDRVGRKQSPETIEKRVAKNTGKKRTEEYRRRASKSHTGYKHTEETKQKLSIINSVPKPHRRGVKLSDEWCKNLSESHMGHSCHLSDEQKQKNGERFAEMNRTRTVHATRLPHRRAMSGENMRRAWQEHPDQMIAARSHKRGVMTSIEKKVWAIVEPLGFTYESIRVRSDQRWYIPDFSCGNLLIEVLGSYWHTEEETAHRVAIFESQGFKVLILWDYEIGYTKGAYSELQNKIETWYQEAQS